MIELLLAFASENEKNGDWTGAEILYRGLLKDYPEHPVAAFRLGSLLLRRGAVEESADLLGQALDADPTFTEAYIQLGNLRQAQGNNDLAMRLLMIGTYLQGIKINPTDAQARFQLAIAFNQADRHRDAARANRQALALQPASAGIHNNLGISLQNLLRSTEAVAAHRRAVTLAPTNADFHCNLAHALLASGLLKEGFAEWEWRTPSPPRDFAQPKWNGSSFAGKVLLAHAEQGYGDVLQFCRYLPETAALGGRLVVECRPPLSGLLGRLPGVSQVVEWGQPLPAFDLQIAIPSLAFALGVDRVSTPAPYLRASTKRLPLWQERIGRAPFKVGLVWAGNAAGHDPKRAIPIEDLVTLANIPGATLFSLQRDGTSTGVTNPIAVDLGAQIADFDDLAAAIDCLDLVISVDTAAAHLAGALGKPVWTLLHASPDWRWLPDATTTAWYPSMRLYRQSTPGDWSGVMAKVAADLEKFVPTRARP
ncbi:MAG TPA: tetratricopeptide repeat protein [Telmatospirillum sp.]|nr:tetratricopeptide repeat protein [Telmatospirillum sp.]